MLILGSILIKWQILHYQKNIYIVTWIAGSFIKSVVYCETFSTWIHLKKNNTGKICFPNTDQLPFLNISVWFSSLWMSNNTSVVLRWPNMGCPDEWPSSPLQNNSSQLKWTLAGLASSQGAGRKEGCLPLNTTIPQQRSPLRTLLPLGGAAASVLFLLFPFSDSNILFILTISHKTLSESKDAECQNKIEAQDFLLPPKENF